MGNLTISMAIFNSYVKLPEGKYDGQLDCRNSYPDDNLLSKFRYIQSSNHSSKIEQRTRYTLVN